MVSKYKKQGWFGQSYRHSQARKGIKTKIDRRIDLKIDNHRDEEYNGWTNRETWAVKLHWDNNQGDQEYFSEQAKEYKKAGRPLHEFADFLEEQAEEIQERVTSGEQVNQEAKLFVQDVGSLWRVDWREIAQAYYDEVE